MHHVEDLFSEFHELSYVRGMSTRNGRPVVGDMCMGSALHANGPPYPNAATQDGKAIERLTRQKHNDDTELVGSDRVRSRAKKGASGSRTSSKSSTTSSGSRWRHSIRCSVARQRSRTRGSGGRSWQPGRSPRRSTASSAKTRRCGSRAVRLRSPWTSRGPTSHRNRRAWAEPRP